MTRIGIMQGRLVPPEGNRIQCFPRDRWAEEFSLASVAGLACIEWIYDVHGEDVNPIATDAGVDQMRALSAQHGVSVVSICADYWMDFPLLRAGPPEIETRLNRLIWLMDRARLLQVRRIVLPFVDNSSIKTDEELGQVTSLLERSLPAADQAGMELHLETDLAPDRFAELLAVLPRESVKVNYDSGNSSALGYQPRDEFAAYGDRVGSMHIKDRLRGGGTVPLGTGNADFVALFDCLRECGYSGDFILQVARGAAGDELTWARQNLQFVRRFVPSGGP